jgi:hypothetical protein
MFLRLLTRSSVSPVSKTALVILTQNWTKVLDISFSDLLGTHSVIKSLSLSHYLVSESGYRDRHPNARSACHLTAHSAHNVEVSKIPIQHNQFIRPDWDFQQAVIQQPEFVCTHLSESCL